MWDVDGLLEAMTPEQMSGWMAYHQIEPFGDEWQQAGTIAAVTFNTLASIAAGFGGHKMKRNEYKEPEDFIPGAEPRSRATTVAEQKAAIQATIGL